jgi:hypothetical protein
MALDDILARWARLGKVNGGTQVRLRSTYNGLGRRSGRDVPRMGPCRSLQFVLCCRDLGDTIAARKPVGTLRVIV